MKKDTVDVGGRLVGHGKPCFIIAEAGVNHNGEIELARQLVKAAVEAGADAIKFQTFNTDQLVTPLAPKADYQTQTTDAEETQMDMIRRLELSRDAHTILIQDCKDKNIIFMSSAFDETSADLLAELDIPVYKIPSGEITNLPLLAHIATNRKPMFVSTGMADLAEVHSAVQTIEAAHNHDILLLQCTSNYPADAADANLHAMKTMETAFKVPVGYSDHTQGLEVALAAVALGASVIEKHLTLDRRLPGPDQQASLEPNEFLEMVRSIRAVESALGHGRKEPANSERSTSQAARKSLVASRDIPSGALLTKEMIAVKRPGTGLPPSMQEHLIGRQVRSGIPEGALITLECLA